MKKVILKRIKYSDQGTFGELTVDDKIYYTVECPDRNNQNNISCVPLGVYEVVKHNSKKYPDVWRLENVPNRSGVLIHWGNWAGDIKKGWVSDSEGCILVGKSIAKILNKRINKEQEGVTSSRVAVDELRETLISPFTLVITDSQTVQR